MPEAAQAEDRNPSHHEEDELDDELTIPEWVEDTVMMMVDHPDDVKCREIAGQRTSVLEVEVHADDVGKLLGREWAHFKAIQTLLRAMGGTMQRHYKLELTNDTRPPPRKRNDQRGGNGRPRKQGRGPRR